MNCTEKHWNTCRVEKMGCKGCNYASVTLASTDKTYCINEKCNRKCWRHKDFYIFNEDGLYWFMEKCEEYEKGERE